MSISKKRNRKILVCFNCRSKKNKCDREHPCGSCKRLGIEATCRFSDGKESPIEEAYLGAFNRPPSTENQDYLREKAFSASSMVIMPHIPMVFADPASTMLWHYWAFLARDFNYHNYSISRANLGVATPKTNVEPKYFPQIQNPIVYSDFDTGKADITKLKVSINEYGKDVGVIYAPFYDKKDPLFARIKQLLPNEKTLITYQKIFFEKICDFIPVLDEFEYFSQLKRLFNMNVPSNEKVKKIHILHKQDYAILAQILLVTRITYIYLMLNQEPVSTPIYLEAIDLAEECIQVHGLLNQPTLPLLQSLLLLQFYRSVAPERLAGFISDQVLRSQVLQVAYTIGMNRDSSLLMLESLSPKIDNLRKKIWHHIVESNTFNECLYLGILRPLTHTYDIPLPNSNSDPNNYRNPVTEQNISDGFLLNRPLVAVLTEILNFSQRVVPNYYDEEFEDLIVKLDNTITKTLGTLDDILKLPAGYNKIVRFKSFLICKIVLVSSSYVSFVVCEEKFDVHKTVPVLDVCLRNLYGDFGNIIPAILNDYKTQFGEMFKLAVLPSLTTALNLSCFITLFMIVRVKCALVNNRRQLEEKNAQESMDSEMTMPDDFLDSHVLENPLLANSPDSFSTPELMTEPTLISKYLGANEDPEFNKSLESWVELLKKYLIVRLKYLIEMAKYNHMSMKLLKIDMNNMAMAFDDNGLYKVLANKVRYVHIQTSAEVIKSLSERLSPSWHTIKNENPDITNCFTVSDILRQDANYNEKLATFIKYDKLWTAKSIMNLYTETNVPMDEEEEPEEFAFNNTLYDGFPTFKEYFGLSVE